MRKWLVSIIGVIIFTNIAVFLDIPILRQLLGIIFLTVIPGLLILFLLKLDKLGLGVKIALTIGLSIAFLIFFGLFLNQVSLLFGYMMPLSTGFLTIALSLALIALLITAYIRNKEAFSSFPFHFELNTRGKLCLLLPSLFPLLSILGTYVLNTLNNNTILLAFLFLIPISIILIITQRRQISPATYPAAVIMISFALLSMFWLRSEHILGHDVHNEYYLFHTTLLNQHWSILGLDVLDASLGISLLPTIYQTLLNVEGIEYLFKGVYVLIGTFTPLAIYVLSKKYVGEIYAFVAALFFAFQGQFMATAGSARTNLAIFFFALSIMVLFHDKISGIKQKGLFIIFMLTTIVSHYTTAYIFFLLLLFTLLIGLALKKYAYSRRATITSVGLFLVLIFLWYSQITEAPFSSGVVFLEQTIRNLQLFFTQEMRSPEIGLLFGLGIEIPFLYWVHRVIIWTSFAFIAIGLIGTLIKRKTMLSTTKSGKANPELLRNRFETDYFLIAVACSGVLIAITALPFVSLGYGMGRTFSQTSVILSVFFILGGVMLAKYFRTYSHLLIMLVLIPLFMFSTGALYEVFGIHWSTTLSSEAPGHHSSYVHDQEIAATQWLEKYREADVQIYAAEPNGSRKLASQGKIPPHLVNDSAFFARQEIGGYIYLDYYNVADREMVIGKMGQIFDLDDYTEILTNKSKLYANGGSEIWR